MALSRLTPRSGKNRLARQKASRTKTTDSQRHLHLWAAIRTTRNEIDQWQRQVDQVDALFGKHIAPRERELTSAVSDVTEQLIGHFSNNQLDMPDQSLLGLWITENLNALHNHPFGDAERMQQLTKQWFELLNNDGPIENQLAKMARINHLDDNNGVSQHDSFFSTGAHEEQQEPVAAAEDQDAIPEQQTQTASDEDTNEDAVAPSSTADKIKSLENKLSVEKLFRQLAKVLHPDREQDEQAKAAKHVLMSECLKARQEKDINALLTLYCEHVGELPDDLNNNSHNELVSALEKQLKELQLELREKRFSDPLHTQIVERYSASSTVDCELRINNHAQSLDIEIESARTQIRQLGDHDGLLDALDERRAVEQDRMSINELTGY